MKESKSTNSAFKGRVNSINSNLKIFLVFLFLSLLFMVSLSLFYFANKNSIESVTTSIYDKKTSTEIISVDLEIAKTPREFAYGLMNRLSIPENHGMLFFYQEERSLDNGFWMYQTKIPLDIAFLDKEGKILSIKQMQPCLSKRIELCPTTYPNHTYQHALEMNINFFENNDISIGDYIDLKPLETKK